MRRCIFALPVALGLASLASPAAAQDKALAIDLGSGVRLDLVLVPAGTQRHGSPANEPNRQPDENERDVTISKPFYMGKLPVTRGQWERFVADTGYRTEAEKGTSGGSGWNGKELVQDKKYNWKSPGFAQAADHPVTLVTFDDALAFTGWLSSKAGRAVTLPTEAQWEHACRANQKTRYCGAADDRQLPDVAWLKTNAGDGTRPAGSRKPNAWGLYDMSGEVWEWTRDWYGPQPLAGTDPEQTNQSLADKPRRVLRGGSWLKDAKNARAAMRFKNTPGSRNADNGLRVVASTVAGSVAPPTTPAGTPTTLPPKGGSDDGGAAAALAFGGLALFAGVSCFGLFVALIVFLIVRSSRRARTEAGARGVRTWAQGDGFFILGPNLARHARIRYSCNVHGQLRRATITYDPSPKGQFVYTGDHPTNVVIEDIGGPAPTGWAQSGAPRRRGHGYDDDYDDGPSPPFTGYPSAY